jgi:Uma2 family endonuclease
MSAITAVAAVVERVVVLPTVSWETYERLLAENPDSCGTRFFFDNGALEIRTVSAFHEEPNRTLSQLIEILALELGIDLRRFGSTTFKRADLQKGFEPDSCFYIRNLETIEGKRNIDLTTDPAPDLVIEIDITSPSLDRFPIFAAVGVAEVWRYFEERVTFHILEDGKYREATHSLSFPILSAEATTRFLKESFELRSTEWSRRVRAWIKEETMNDER